jgi:hypothetical protein
MGFDPCEKIPEHEKGFHQRGPAVGQTGVAMETIDNMAQGVVSVQADVDGAFGQRAVIEKAEGLGPAHRGRMSSSRRLGKEGRTEASE